ARERDGRGLHLPRGAAVERLPRGAPALSVRRDRDEAAAEAGHDGLFVRRRRDRDHAAVLVRDDVHVAEARALEPDADRPVLARAERATVLDLEHVGVVGLVALLALVVVVRAGAAL